MTEELDDELRKRISEVFDNYDDQGADEGWVLLREKMTAPAKRGSMAWLWWASAAAAILLFVTIALLMQRPSVTKEKKLVAMQQTDSNIDTEDAGKNATETVKDNDTATGTENNIASANINEGTIATKHTEKQGLSHKEIATATGRGAVNTIIDTASQLVSTVTKGENDRVTNTPRTQLADNPQQPVIASVPVDQQPVTTTTTPTAPASVSKDAVLAMIDEDARRNVKSVKKDEQDERNVNFGLYAATFFNYAKGSDNKVNVGAGVTSDFRLSKNLKLSTGISIAQNSFNYAGESRNDLPPAAASASAVVKLASTDTKGFNSAVTTAPELDSYNARLVGLEIPVNLKFAFNPGKTDTYILAGFSSGTFISQNYNYNFNYASPISKEENQQVKETIESPSLNNFYFAKTLNFALGVGYPVGKGNRLVVEPFVKYPLDGLGAQQIKFGAGGINLRFNFGAGKK